MYWSYPYGMMAGSGLISQQQPGRQPGQPVPPGDRDTGRIFSEDLMQRNVGKRITVYMTFDASEQWRNRVFTGTLREVGRDFFVIRDQKSGKDMMMLNINLDYVVFDEPAVVREASYRY
ncbi:spore coat protein GerQ [Lihuaxuella thermophila]|uniref:Spore germination protein Q n=1 Tax=Lihuaxuella thermophila TaxID=1173111 RepID=A0A1H8ADV5_9BACL|nr:spore coat protein GerQ [Lihuaxuella thermophila]SEM68723.1 spore germination protein Q [Lihuaxuella thermophila]